MKITAGIINYKNTNEVTLKTNDNLLSINIPPKENGFGSSANGGELLFLALAACYCNDIYREASKMQIEVEKVEVEVTGEFVKEGEPASNISYNVKITASAPKEKINELIRRTDRAAEIQNTLRQKNNVALKNIEIIMV
jgi:uncharacterized OsmC-like protein